MGPGGDFSQSGMRLCKPVQLKVINDVSVSSHLVFEQFPTISSISRVRSIFSKGFGVVGLRSVPKVFRALTVLWLGCF